MDEMAAAQVLKFKFGTKLVDFQNPHLRERDPPVGFLAGGRSYKHSLSAAIIMIDGATQATKAASPSVCRRRHTLQSDLGLLDTDIQSWETHPRGRLDRIALHCSIP